MNLINQHEKLKRRKLIQIYLNTSGKNQKNILAIVNLKVSIRKLVKLKYIKIFNKLYFWYIFNEQDTE